ncbi:OPA3-domain-containing protein [Trametes punicea]|nr:OPA3-domain-containing protein [Trametes punicea]
MASAKIAQLLIRTLAKPISNQIKVQAKQHEKFRSFCVGLAQRMYQTEARLRTNLLGEPAKHVRPLSETRAIENGANALAEGFLFSVAASLILAETWRSSRNQSKRRDAVDESLDSLKTSVQELKERLDTLSREHEQRFAEESMRHDKLAQIIQHIVEIGLRGGWTELPRGALQDVQVDSVKRSSMSSIPPSDSQPADSIASPISGLDSSSHA